MSEHDGDPPSGEGHEGPATRGNTPQPEVPGLGLPGLGVPALGVPTPGATPPQSTYSDPDPNDPRNYPGALPPGMGVPQPKVRKRVGVGRVILLVFLVLAGSGWLVRTIRQTRATPADKAACAATLSAFQTDFRTAPAMLSSLEFANDKTLLAARGDMTTHLQQRDTTALGNDINKVIHRCNGISSSFKSGFQSYCDTHPGVCKETFHIGPF